MSIDFFFEVFFFFPRPAWFERAMGKLLSRRSPSALFSLPETHLHLLFLFYTNI